MGPTPHRLEHAKVRHLEQPRHAGAHSGRDGGGERHDGHGADEAAQALPHLQVALAKVVAPLADAVRLVDGDKAQQALRQRAHSVRRPGPVQDSSRQQRTLAFSRRSASPNRSLRSIRSGVTNSSLHVGVSLWMSLRRAGCEAALVRLGARERRRTGKWHPPALA